MRFFLSFFLLSVLLSSPSHAGGNLRTIAETGEPAAGFPDGFVYLRLYDPFIGNDGHIAFSGSAYGDTPEGFQEQNAVWYGKPGQLDTAIRERESPAGFPANIVFSSADDAATLTLSNSGDLAFAAFMKGAQTGTAYLATVNGSIHGVIQENAVAEGFPPGTTVNRLDKFYFSDAGMSYQGQTNQYQDAIWFWNHDKIELVATTDREFSQLYPGCNFTYLLLLDMNQQGELLFQALLQTTGVATCPRQGLFTWKENTFRQIVVEGQTAPATPAGTVFANSSFASASINDNGDVSFLANIEDSRQYWYPSAWFARANGDIAPVALIGETLPGNPTETLSLQYAAFAANANTTNILRTKSSTQVELVLVGPPKQGANIPDLDNPGASQLEILIRSDEPLPGFDPSWYLKSIIQIQINNQDNYSLWVDAKDAASATTEASTQIWTGNDASSLRLLVMEGEPVLIDGLADTVIIIEHPWDWRRVTRSSNSGQPSQFNDHGQLVFHAYRESTTNAILLLGMAATPECTGQVVGIPARTYADGEIIYCVGDESLSTVADESVHIASGAVVTYESPVLHLNRGFSVALGGRFTAVTP